MLLLKDVRKTFREPDGTPLPILAIAEFRVAAGEQVVLMGKSGAGKTTLLHVIAGISRPDSGMVQIDGTDITRLSEAGRDRFRADKIGYVFQTFNLLGGFSALENVLLGMTFAGGRADPARARRLLERVGLHKRESHRPAMLSVGEQQRVAVARALANRPKLLLADEPTANVDSGHQQQIVDLVRETCQEENVALLLVTHTPEVSEQFGRVERLEEFNRALAPVQFERRVNPRGNGHMSLWKIAWRSIQQRGLASSLTGMSMALGVMLVVAVLVIHGVINRSFLNNSSLGYNVLVGAKGGRLELVLNSVYYLARPIENIPYSAYLDLKEGKYKQYVDKAIPICLGDTYGEFRVVGTTPEFFNALEHGGQKYEFEEGTRNFEPDEYFGAVIGATVAAKTGLKRGDTFQPAHGVGPEAHVHDPFTVLGVLKPTGTPNDRALFINMEGFYLIPEHAKPLEEGAAPSKPEVDHAAQADADHKHDHPAGDAEQKHEHPGGETDHPHEHAATGAEHQHEPAEGEADHKHEHTAGGHAHEHGDHDHHHHGHAHEPLPIAQREVTAVLVLTASFAGAPPELMAPPLIKAINKDNVAQAVLPIREMTSLFDTFVNPLRLILLGLTVTIVVVSGIGILVSIYNSMSERQHEIAVMRALGAGRQTVMLLVLLESILLSLAGGLAGWAIGHGLIALLSPWIAVQTGVSLGFFQFVGYELVIIPGLIVLAAIVGYLPALAAYRTDVAKALSATP